MSSNNDAEGSVSNPAEEEENVEEQLNLDGGSIRLRVITPDGEEITLEGISVSSVCHCCIHSHSLPVSLSPTISLYLTFFLCVSLVMQRATTSNCCCTIGIHFSTK
jgi:hypothetical protein